MKIIVIVFSVDGSAWFLRVLFSKNRLQDCFICILLFQVRRLGRLELPDTLEHSSNVLIFQVV